MRSLLAAVALSVAAGGCGDEPRATPLPCPPEGKECAFQKVISHRAKTKAAWEAAFAKPLADRIGPATPELVELIALDNIANGFPQRPRASRMNEAFVADVRAAFAELPEAVKRSLDKRLAGIYFVDDLGGTGYTEKIVDKEGRSTWAFIVLDPTALAQHTANSWATWRDGTPFKPDVDWTLVETIEAPANDNRKNAIQYILLHEIAHVLSVGAQFHPDWNLRVADIGSTEAYPFFNLSWVVERGEKARYATRFDATFPQRRDVVYYFGPKIAGDAMVATYEGLEKTNLPTLYAASNPGDDFAESYANFVHVVVMQRPFEIRLTRRGEVAKTYKACWDEERCAAKRAILEALLK